MIIVRDTHRQLFFHNLPSKKVLLLNAHFYSGSNTCLHSLCPQALPWQQYHLNCHTALPLPPVWQQTMLTLMSAFCASSFTIFTALLQRDIDLLAPCFSVLLGCPLKWHGCLHCQQKVVRLCACVVPMHTVLNQWILLWLKQVCQMNCNNQFPRHAIQ